MYIKLTYNIYRDCTSDTTCVNVLPRSVKEIRFFKELNCGEKKYNGI